MEQLHSLKLTQTEGESELEHLRRMMDELRQENDQLHSNNQRQKELIVNLQTRAEMLEGGTTMADRRLREQLTASEEERREAEVTAIQRLDDIIQLKTQLEDANLVITDLKVGFSDNYQVIKVIKHESLVSISSQSVSLADYSVLHVGISQDQCLVQILPSGHVSSTG